ncbi:MAG: hypothetical protein J0H94_03240 [Rhizobiales bacterium]|nr:hypothetical protein [Hyphomicrobiales bacterium]
MTTFRIALATAALLAAGGLAAHAADAKMSFFVSSTGSGDGANLGGLAGADALCDKLATAAGSTGKTWHAYLSATGVNAKDRIGKGPWYNAKGELIASSLDELHGPANKITKQTALTEAGNIVNGRGDNPNQHDILTGSNPDGTLAEGKTCGDWTSDAADGLTIVGHSDRTGLDESDAAKSWNSSHPTKGCGQQGLVSTGGAGYLYCFAVEG